MSDTPETNAQLTTFDSISKLGKRFTNKKGTLSAEFARKLERERDESLKLLREARDQCYRLRRDRLAITRAYDDVCQQLDEAREELEWRRLDSQTVNDILEVIDPYIDKNDHSKSVDEWIKELIKQLRFALAKVAEVELVLDGYLEYEK